MIACDDVRACLTEFLDGELPEEDAQHIQEHLDACTACTRILAHDLALRAAVIDALPLDTVDVWGAVSAQISADDDSTALLTELREMHRELAHLRTEVAGMRAEITDLRRELAKRPLEPMTRRLPTTLPGVRPDVQRPYRLI